MKMQELLLVAVAAAAVLQAALSSAAVTDDWDVTVEITNGLASHQSLQVHCKDKHSDFGVQHVPSGRRYDFGFNPSYRGDYFCGFVFNGALHWFDIYIDKRDWKHCGFYSTCSWIVREAGPCLRRPGAPDVCYPWNPDVIRRH